MCDIRLTKRKIKTESQPPPIKFGRKLSFISTRVTSTNFRSIGSIEDETGNIKVHLYWNLIENCGRTVY